MTSPVRIIRHPWGPRVYCAGLRVHHGAAAGLLAAGLAAAGHRRAAALALAIAATDARDFPFTDSHNHRPAWARREHRWTK